MARAQQADRALATRYAEVGSVLARYYEGLYRCDLATLRAVFHPEAHYFTASEGALLHLDMPAYQAVIEKRHSPEDRGETYGYEIEAIEFAGPATAIARMRIAMLSKDYTDFLSLLRVEGEWRIVAKVFHAVAEN